jgi:hypothetical protein
MSERKTRWETTLKGVGPVRCRAAWLSREAVDRYRRQNERYEWFAGQVRAEAPLDLAACHSLLSTSSFGPGRLERAMVALSLSDDPVAAVILEFATSPDWGQSLMTFHSLCLHRSLSCVCASSQ